MLASLPEKYYLSHAGELFSFVEQECAHLLEDNHLAYLRNYSKLDEDAQCLLVRFLTRKPKFLARHSLQYPEIDDLNSAERTLTQHGYISPVSTQDWAQLVPLLTKPVLLDCLRSSPLSVKASTPKAELVILAKSALQGDEPFLFAVRDAYLVRRQQETVDYILFLFFGDLRNRLQKFAMRDLGVLKTRANSQKQVARFSDREEALSAFTMQLKRRDFKSNPLEQRQIVGDFLLANLGIGPSAEEARDKLLLQVGAEFAVDQPEQAIALWRASNQPQALERWVRETYKTGDRDALKIELEQLQEEPMAAPSRIFIEDFYTRKYLGKRTSVYTDMLRESSRSLSIDESFINSVEEGVIQHYRRVGAEAYFTENKLWRVLFALTFWDLLFGEQRAQFSEFDFLPAALKQRDFYQRHEAAIYDCLAIYDDAEAVCKRFTRLAALHYGYPTGLFRWDAGLLDSVHACILNAPRGAIAAMLQKMARDFRNSRDGYPDLLVIDQGGLRFEEVKAPADSLRPNQLVSVQRLRSAGFTVKLSQVNWATDPKQVYAVVDIETTGGRKGGNAITEIAVVKVQNQRVIGEWSTLVNPQRPIPAHITHLTGIDNAMVAKAPVFSQIADELEAQLRDSIFVAHNVGFDYGFIKSAFASINREFKMPRFCTVSNSRKTFPGLKSYALGNLTAHFDIDLENHHRALSDASATADLLVLIQQARAQAVSA
ncbi:MAG: exonuclease domain-containing protein [Pseudomonadota bacterium]